MSENLQNEQCIKQIDENPTQDSEVEESEESLRFYDEVEIEDMQYDPKTDSLWFPRPCGDLFRITKQQLRDGEEVVKIINISKIIRVRVINGQVY